ncbi:hypothetical protein EBT25_16955 [bacterium]|nr:hypothetical protein [bacterium]
MKINDAYLGMQLDIIKSTMEEAMLTIRSLREENEQLRNENQKNSDLLEFLLRKSGDIHTEQTA